jgi:hypothetical protein
VRLLGGLPRRLGTTAAAIGAALALTGCQYEPAGETVYEVDGTRFTSGAEWDGRGRFGISEAEARMFDSLPLAWLGTAFAGYNLTGISPTGSGSPTANYPVGAGLVFGYGDCGPPKCRIPLQVDVLAVCRGQLWTQDGLAEQLPAGAAVQRPEPGNFEEGHKVRIFTGAAMISVSWVDPEISTEEVLGSLSSPHGATLGPPEPPDCR